MDKTLPGQLASMLGFRLWRLHRSQNMRAQAESVSWGVETTLCKKERKGQTGKWKSHQPNN